MAIPEYARRATNKYKREKYQRVEFGFTKALWNDYLSPAIGLSELGQSSFIRVALIEKILKDGLYKKEDEAFLKDLIRKISEKGEEA